MAGEHTRADERKARLVRAHGGGEYQYGHLREKELESHLKARE